MLLAGENTRARAADLTLPVLILHGADDKLTNPAGSEEFHARAASPDKSFRPWPGLRHELHNEPEQADVIAAILAWLDAHTPAPERLAP
jgi:lysophospholipase